MPEPLTWTEKSRGKRALDRARLRADGGVPRGGVPRKSRLPKAVLAPEALRMQRMGMSVPRIGRALQRSPRYIRYLLAYAKETGGGMLIEIPDPRTKDQVAEQFQHMLVYTGDAFEAFFTEFSEYGYLPEHAKQWVQDFLDNRRVLLNVPPGHAKSTILSVWLPLWLVCLDRDEQILIVSKTEDLAKKFTNEISFHMESNEKLISAFGRFRPELTSWPWRPNSGELLVEGRRREAKSGDLSVQIRGSGQQILGMRATKIIVDDPTDDKVSKSETERKDLSEWFHKRVMSRLDPDGHAVVIGQRVHLLDLYGELERKKKTRVPGAPPVWHTIKYPAVLEWGDPDRGILPTVLWPERWPFEELMEKYEDVGGNAAFECMYQQNPLPEGERVFKANWIENCLDKDRGAGQSYRENTEGGIVPVARVLSIDPSPTRFAGVIVADVPYAREVFGCSVLEMVRERMGVREMNDHIKRILVDYGPVDYLIFETNISHFWMQTPEFQALRNHIRVLPHATTGKSKNDPQYGVQSLAVDFEFGRIRMPYGDAEARHQSDMLVNELENWPQGETDDLLMALWFIRYRYSALLPIRQMPTRFRTTGPFHAPERTLGWAAFRRE